MIGDACFIACNKIYNLETKQWEDNGTREPTQFITTEQEEDEIQTMMIAFLSGVDETHILENTYIGDEWERVNKAADILSKSPLYIKKLPDLTDYKIIDVLTFNELLDAHSEVRMPINYFRDDIRSYFILLSDNTAWRYVMKRYKMERK